MAGTGSVEDAPRVPRFSSFKSKEVVASPGPQSADRTGDVGDGHGSETRPRARHHRRHGRDSSRARRRQHSPGPTCPGEKEPASGLFVVDTRGDRLISRYGGMDRAQIPVYHRHGGGRVLGTAGRLVIHRDEARDRFSLYYPEDGVGSSQRDGLRSKSLRFTADSIRVRPGTRTRTEDEHQERDAGFLRVRRSKKRKQGRGTGHDSSSSDGEGASYRSIEGMAKSRVFDDESGDSSCEDDEAAVDVERDDPLRWKSIQLGRRVRDQPGDIDAWLQLVDHQDDLQRVAESAADERTSAHAARSFSEIKVSMLESALENTRAAEDRRAVTVRLMREGVKIWPAKTATKKWSELAGDEESHFELWRAHVDFAMTDIAALNYDDIKRMLLDRLRKVLARTSSPSTEHDDCYSEAIHVFLRATRFVHDAGYKELAVASWQALLELNFFRPPHHEDEGSRWASFRDFWESEVPRIGDAEAQGWRHYVARSGQVDAPEPQTGREAESLCTGDVFKAWAHSEQALGDWARMPARTMDDGTEDDPFRVVIFSDIEPWLFSVPESRLEGTLAEELMDAFLIFCGLPPRYRSSEWTRLACADQFTFRAARLAGGPSDGATAVRVEDQMQMPPRRPHFDAGNGSLAMSPATLFSRTGWFNCFGRADEDPDADVLAVDAPWALNTLKQLVHGADVQSLALYHLGATHVFCPSAVKRTAKAVLRKYPHAAEVYNGYALAEFANGNVDAAEKVISSAVESPSLRQGALGWQLFHSWSWFELEKGNKLMAAIRLCSAVDESVRCSATRTQSIPPAVVLKTRQTMEAAFRRALYEGRVDDAGSYAECTVLWSYLMEEGGCAEPTSASQGNISSSMRVIENMSAEFKSAGYGDAPGHERLLQTGARLLYLNASRGPFRRAHLRHQLSTFLERFPRNTIFLALLEWADSSLRVVDETRQLLHDRILIRGRDCITSRIFSIQHELLRGNTNSTRAAYEHALSSDVCKSNVSLWLSYVRFCHWGGRALRLRAKDVFYRALRHCPWSKEVMMEAFGTLIHDMTSDELQSVYETMASKGLRVHLDLEEYVERWRREGNGRR
ncbi:hypothetical protein E4U42_002084 [Claviceps africana]|uniref:DUF1740-domain-containing protein n=1 Tax=Claviceps africana TaxID=83212 RepID=A0A8K0J958_9HYPO|nr:hypothetical protein E4U42_002084 [Claviceps africana]